jgi:hypothetical protein
MVAENLKHFSKYSLYICTVADQIGPAVYRVRIAATP